VCDRSTAANGNNNLDPVAINQRDTGMIAARHDLTVAFNGDTLAGMAERINECGNRQRGRELARFAIDHEFH
jgi:hypothetical protein